MNLVEDFVRMGLARFFGIRMHDVRIRREHRLLSHCNVAPVIVVALVAAAAVLCASLLSHRHSNDADAFDVVHRRFQQL